MLTGLIGLGLAGYNAYKGRQAEKQSNDYNTRAIQQAERDYNERAPLRRQGMQALGQIEAPIDMGNIGYNAANPFAAARGPAASTASLGNWGRMTYDMPPEERTAQPSPQDMLTRLPAGAPPQVRKALEQGLAKRGIMPLGGGR